MFEDIDSALDYVAKCTSNREDLEEAPFPPIYTLCGHRILPGGIVDLKDKMPTPRQLPAVFGQPPPRDEQELAHLQHDVEAAGRALALAAARMELHAQLLALKAAEEEDIAAKRRRAEEIRQALEVRIRPIAMRWDWMPRSAEFSAPTARASASLTAK